MTGRGTLILVVGPSGVGKDSIIAGGAERFGGDPRIIFARRMITRPLTACGEQHLAVSAAEFAECRDAGRLMAHWHAHGFDYGLPRTLAAELDAGRSVVANVSRTVVADVRERFAPAIVVAVSASAETLAARLASRGREGAEDIGSRLQRAAALPPGQADFTIDNDEPLDVAIDQFVALLRMVLGQPASA